MVLPTITPGIPIYKMRELHGYTLTMLHGQGQFQYTAITGVVHAHPSIEVRPQVQSAVFIGGNTLCNPYHAHHIPKMP
jgi:hypothetical protein